MKGLLLFHRNGTSISGKKLTNNNNKMGTGWGTDIQSLFKGCGLINYIIKNKKRRMGGRRILCPSACLSNLSEHFSVVGCCCCCFVCVCVCVVVVVVVVVVVTEHLDKDGETCCMSNSMKQKRIQTPINFCFVDISDSIFKSFSEHRAINKQGN